MSKINRTWLFKWIRGAQSTIHEITMFTQSIASMVTLGLTLVALIIFGFAVGSVDNHERYLAFKSMVAFSYMTVFSNPTMPVVYRDRDGTEYEVPAKTLWQHDKVRGVWEKMGVGARRGALISGPLFLLSMGGVAVAFSRAGARTTDDAYIRGTRITHRRNELQRALVKEGAIGKLSIAGIRLPSSYETAHQLFLGGPGTGKTVLLSRQLAEIRAAGRRAIVYDTAGVFVERFYRPGKDVILNPLDARSPAWTLWGDITHSADYEHMAKVVIPAENHAEPFWAEAAQVTFRAVARKLAEAAQQRGTVPTNEDLVRILTRTPLEEFAAYIADTEAVSIISDKGEKMAASVRATITSKLTGFSYLTDTGPRFSIKEFVRDGGHDQWLFITSKADQLDALRNLITLWVDIAVGEILSLRPDMDRRIYFMFDELPSLGRLPSLQNAMAQSRKFGGCVALGLQSIEQLRETYGRHVAEAITGNCATWTLLRTNDAETARWASSAIGDTEQSETNEGLSIAKNDIGDRRTLNRQVVARPAVLPSELRQLPNLQGYVFLGRGHPVLRTRFPYESFEEHEPAFATRDEPKLPLVDDPFDGVPGLVPAADATTPKPEQRPLSEPDFAPTVEPAGTEPRFDTATVRKDDRVYHPPPGMTLDEVRALQAEKLARFTRKHAEAEQPATEPDAEKVTSPPKRRVGRPRKSKAAEPDGTIDLFASGEEPKS